MLLAKAFERLILRHADALGGNSKRGRPRVLTNEEALSHAFRICRTGMQWREIQSCVSYATVFRRVSGWMSAGVFQRAYADALRLYKRLVPTQRYVADSTKARNKYGRRRFVGRDYTDRGRLAIKLSILTDQNGVVHALRSDTGNIPDVSLLRSLLQSAFDGLERLQLHADRGYDSRNNRNICAQHGLLDRIMRRRTRSTRRANARRVVVEHAFAWLDGYRRLHRMYENVAYKYEAFATLAFGHLMARRFLASTLVWDDAD